jgi:hypothetical protein
MKQTMRTCSRDPDGASDARIAFIISVPPPLRRPARNRLASAMFSCVAGTGAGNSRWVSPENVIRLKRSRGCKPSIAAIIASFALSNGKPCMEPDVSITNTISFGVISSRAG